MRKTTVFLVAFLMVLSIGAFNICENFEFTMQGIGEYLGKLGSHEHFRIYGIYVVKTKALIGCAVKAQMICAFDLAYAKNRFTHNVAHLCHEKMFQKALAKVLKHRI